MNKLNKKGAGTRARRQKFFNQYYDIARGNNVKLSYADIAELDKSRGKNSFKSQFHIFLSGKIDNKEKYIKQHYKLNKEQAKEVLNIHLAENIPIKNSVKVLTGEVTRSAETKNWLELLSDLSNKDLFKDYKNTVIKFGLLGVEMLVSEFVNQRAILRQELETLLSARVQYPVLEPLNINFVEFGDLTRGKIVRVSYGA